MADKLMIIHNIIRFKFWVVSCYFSSPLYIPLNKETRAVATIGKYYPCENANIVIVPDSATKQLN